MFSNILDIVSDLPKPDHLDTVQIGMVTHLQKWIIYFMKACEWLHKYCAIWLPMSAYHNLTQKNTLYKEVFQCNGKEMKEISRYLLGVVNQSLRGGSC